MFDTVLQNPQNVVILCVVGVFLLLIVLAICCGSSDKHPQFPRKNGRWIQREMTDRGCAACFIVCLALCGFFLFWGFMYGDPKRLTHGMNWEGKICGEENPGMGGESVLDKKFLYFCGSPERTIESGTSFPKFILQGSTACVAACPTTATAKIQCLQPAFHNFTVYRQGTLPAPAGQVGLTNVETLDLTVTQSLVNQASYATEAFGGRYCVPDSKLSPRLHEDVVHGPWGRHVRPMLAFGGLLDAVFLLGLSAVLAILCSLLYFNLLRRCAGPVIFASMILGGLLLLAIGAIMLWVVFLDPVNPPKDYAKINPIFSVYEGAEAKTYSVIMGMIFVMAAGVTACLAATSMGHIDEMIGIIDAALECTGENGFFAFTYPLVQAATFIALFVFMVISIPYVASLGRLDPNSIKVDGQAIPGLQKHWVRSDFDKWSLAFYVFFCWWLLEICIQYANFIIAYVVAKWYFVPVKETKVSNKALKGFSQEGKAVQVRVGGVDQNYGNRAGTVVHDARGNRVLVVPVGKKAPGLGRYNLGDQMAYEKDKGQIKDIAWTLGANFDALTKHIGSLALGAPIIAILRPLRLFSQCVSGFLNRVTPDPLKGPGADLHPGNANLKGCFALFSACLDQIVGKYSKNAFTEMVLAGGRSGHGGSHMFDDFGAACDASFKFLVTCGGSVAYLHGAMLLYEAFGCISITCFCGWVVLVVQDKVDWFNEQESSWYIEDKNASVIAACIVAFVVTYCWMSLWNQTADVLLYCVAWNRRQAHLAHEFDIHGHDAIVPPKNVCPNALRQLIPEYELDAHYEHGIHAHGVGQMGAIIAAMEHGAMNTNAKGPNYSTAMGSVFQTGTRIGNF
mmetsp:Transcript_60559/g.94186  ORF Transcript_60559/g.94186 Transcript_60559/m.94186 type:complete len:849 (-) Transcript_60559:238-2784(-)